MAVNRRYFEVRTSSIDPTTVTYVGEAGAALTPDMSAEYYK